MRRFRKARRARTTEYPASDAIERLSDQRQPPEATDVGDLLDDVDQRSRALVAATTFIGMDLPRAAGLLGIEVEAAREHVLSVRWASGG